MTKATALAVQKKKKIVGLDAAAQYFALRSRAQNTLRAYKADVQHFAEWCIDRGIATLPIPSAEVANYLGYLAASEFKRSTIQRRIYAIRFLHVENDFQTPTDSKKVKDVWSGIKRAIDANVSKRKAAVTEIIRQIIKILPDNLIGLRDQALLLQGYAGAYRRSELVATDVEHLDFQKAGVLVYLPRSKTDQAGEGKYKAISYGSNIATCPVRTLQDWLAISGIESGAVYRSIKKGNKLQEERLSDRAVYDIVVKRVREAGLDPKDFGAHSLRSGFATQAAANNVHVKKMMDQGWNTPAALMDYIQQVELFEDNASAMLGL